MHVCQPWTNVAKTHHKTSDPKIFISHIPLLNFAGAALHITPRMWANPSWTDVPLQTSIRKFASHTSQFWTLPEQLRNRWHLHVPTLNQCCKWHTTKPDPIFISHIPLLNFAGQLSILHHACEPTHPPSHTSLFWTLPEQLSTDYTTHVCQPWTNVPKTHHKTSDPKIFISKFYTTHLTQLGTDDIPVSNFAGAALHITPRMCAKSWRRPKTHHKTSIRKFASHTSLFLNFALNQCAPNPSWTKDTPQNLRP